jgi:hypothetical protein
VKLGLGTLAAAIALAANLPQDGLMVLSEPPAQGGECAFSGGTPRGSTRARGLSTISWELTGDQHAFRRISVTVDSSRRAAMYTETSSAVGGSTVPSVVSVMAGRERGGKWSGFLMRATLADSANRRKLDSLRRLRDARRARGDSGVDSALSRISRSIQTPLDSFQINRVLRNVATVLARCAR